MCRDEERSRVLDDRHRIKEAGNVRSSETQGGKVGFGVG